MVLCDLLFVKITYHHHPQQNNIIQHDILWANLSFSFMKSWVEVGDLHITFYPTLNSSDIKEIWICNSSQNPAISPEIAKTYQI